MVLLALGEGLVVCVRRCGVPGGKPKSAHLIQKKTDGDSFTGEMEKIWKI